MKYPIVKYMKVCLHQLRALLTFAAISCLSFTYAQTFEIQDAEYNNNNELFHFKPDKAWSRTPMENLPDILSTVYRVNRGWNFVTISHEEDKYGSYYKLMQTFNGAEVYGGDIALKFSKTGELLTVFGTIRNVTDLTARPTLNADSALLIAFKSDNANRIHLDINPETGEYYEPVIKLIYAPANGNSLMAYKLCYEIEILYIYPQRYFYYIDAKSGEIIHKISAMLHASGTGNSLYSGSGKQFNSSYSGNVYTLVDSIRNIRCYDHRENRLWFDFAGKDDRTIRNLRFPDNNNEWASGFQKAAVDVHWGMTKVYDYYKNVHNRNSFDGAGSIIFNRVHCDAVEFTDKFYPLDSITKYDSLWNNATWNGECMSYGDGDGTQFSPLVSLDIVGHEFTHAVVQHTADLKYQGESGALNESFADIFGACIEFYGKTGNFEMGEECYTPNSGGDNLRNMANPNSSGANAYEKQPDCYKGDYWKDPTAEFDHGGVHFNSGVSNFWFYLLCQGGDDENEKGDDYDVDPIGMDKAQEIAYRALKFYMTSLSDFKAARKATLEAAEDIYGKESSEYKAVCEAWFAVNVGDKCCADSIELEFEVTDAKCVDSKDGEIKLTVKKSDGPFEYRWYKGDTASAVISTSKDLTGLDTGTYYAIVRDTVAKCEASDKTDVEAPEPVEVSVSGGGNNDFRVCDGTPKTTLSANASGGTPPYEYSWPGGQKTVSADGEYTAIATDKNNCKGEQSTTVTFIPVLCSRDPNDIIGPKSYGEKKFVSKFATQQYKIRFENDPKFATAPASKVTVDLPLDDNMNMNSFRVGSFGFNNWTFTVPSNLTTYNTRLDLRDTLGIYVDVTAGVDIGAKKAYWILESIDPSTGLPPTSGALGFLPVNDTALHNGEGFVDFTIRAKSTTNTGDSLRAAAEIIFDDNPSIHTPRIHNIIDAKPPVSKLDSMPAVMNSATFTLRFRVQDDAGGSGVKSTNLYYSHDNNAYKLYQENITDTFVSFTGVSGSAYKFYTIAADNVDNKEANKTTSDVSLSIVPADFLKPLDSALALCVSDTLLIEWKKVPITSFNLQFKADTGAYVTIATSVSGADTSYRWKLPYLSATSASISIRAVTAAGSPLDETGPFTLRPSPTVELGNDTFFCDGSSISLILDAGAGFSSYFWTDSSTSQTLSVNSEGTYGVTLSNSFGCEASDQVNVERKLRPLVSSKSISNIACYGETNGAVSLVVVSGTQPYTYIWSNTDTSEDISGLAAGTYSVGISDAMGCVATDTSIITEPAQLLITGNIVQVKCKNGNDGSINLSASGGTAPLSFAWSNSASTEDLSGLIAGTYSVTVSDARGCTRNDTFVITEPALLTASIIAQNVKCKNGSDGSADLSISGGTAPYTQVWSNSAVTEDINLLIAGTYSVLIKDANLCELRDTVTITEPPLLTAGISAIHVKCKNGSDGSVDLTAGGGTTPYTYLWSNSAVTQDLSNLNAGIYSVLLSDANACIIRDTVQITEPALLAISNSFQNVKCKNGNDGSIDITISGGVIPYTYLWSNSAVSQDLNTLTAGTYSVLITDSNACTARDTFSISEPALLTSVETILNVKCKNGNDGSIDLTVSGGVTPYTYLWSNTATTQDISGLTAGTYSVRITDANACILRDTSTITEPALLVSSKTFLNVKCKNGNDGSIDLSVSGGTSPYTYLWSNSASTQDLSGLIAGTYTVLITDANSCTRRDTVTITEPALLTRSKTFANVKCKNGSDGSIDLTVNGGTTPYTYLWSNSATTQDLSGLTAGTYSVGVTDFNGCVVRDTTTIAEPTLLTKSKTTQMVKCKNGNDGSIDLSVSGGVTPYTYLWSNSATTQDLSGLTAGTYSVRVTDANACILRDTSTITEPALLVSSKTFLNVKCKNGSDGSIDLSVSGGTSPYTYLWSNSASTQDLSGLIAGTYTVLITDANSCTRRDTVTITEPALLTRSKTFANVKCKNGSDGSIDLTVNGGTTPYTYLWSNSATTQDLSGLTTGTYSVRVTDFNGCVVRDTTTIAEPTLLTKSKTTQMVKCKNGNDGSIDLSVSGGVTPYTYLWSNSATTQDLSGLTAGTYSVRVTDANACILRDTSTITEPALLVSSKTSQNVRCKNGSDGSIDLSVSGGTSPYIYLWSNNAATQDLSGLAAGTYTVLITDANSCTRRDTVTITEPALLTSAHTSLNVKCKNGNDGSIDVSLNGGTTPYSYVWSNSANTQDLSGLTAGTYSLIATDALGCVVRDTVVISEPTLLTKSRTFENVKCKNGSDAKIDLTVNGGTTPYSYLWSNGSVAQDLSGLRIGTFTVRITDANACVVRDTVIISEPALLTSGIAINDVLCYGGSDGSINSNGIGGTAPYNYSWSSGESSSGISGKTKGTYIVTITDQNACSRKDTIVIGEPSAPLSLSKISADVKCHAGNDGSVNLSVNGGTLPYTYSWSNGSSTEDISSLLLGTYSVLISDKNSCILRDTTLIRQPLAPLSSNVVLTAVKCFAGSDGAVDLSVAGGTGPYTFLWSNTSAGEDLNNVVSGLYKVLITDANNCTLSDSGIVTQPSAPLSIVLSENNINCFGGNDGSIDALVGGGTLPYTFSWSNGAATEDISNVTEGKYVLLVSDFNNCVLKDSIILTQPSAPLSAVLTIDDVDCYSDNTGAVALSPSGGTAPYTYSWSNGASTRDISGLVKGWYTITMNDVNNCVFKDSAFVPEPTELKVKATGISATEAASNGTAWAEISGGTPPYSIAWNDPAAQTNDTAVSLSIGSYIVTVTDAKGCSLTDTAEVPAAPDPSTIGIFPNPSTGNVTVFNLASLGLDETITIELFDLSGKMFMDFKVSGKDIHSFDLYESFANGTYIVRIRNSRGIENRRLIVIR